MTEVQTYPTIDEAARAMARGAAYMGGGTIVMREVNAGTAAPVLVRTDDPTLRQLRVQGDTVSLGAGVTMAQILAEQQLDFLHPVARRVGGPQVRNMGTVGGNLFAAHPYGDFAVALLALGARVQLAGTSGARPVEDILRDRARRDGLVAAIEVPRPRRGSFGFTKVSRVKPKGVSILSIAVLAPQTGGTLRGVRVALGGMGSGPLRSAAVERALDGQRLDRTTLEKAQAVASDGLQPPTDALASAWYRSEVVGVHLRRLLQSMESS